MDVEPTVKTVEAKLRQVMERHETLDDAGVNKYARDIVALVLIDYMQSALKTEG